MAMSKQGGYYVKDNTGKYVEATKEQYDQVKSAYDAERKRDLDASNKAIKDAADREATERANAMLRKYEADMEAKRIKQERDEQLYATSFYALQAKSQASSGMKSLASFEGTFESLEELQSAFESQTAAIRQQQEVLADATRSHFSASMDYAFKDADAGTAAYKGLANAVGGALSEAAAAQKARQAREQLERQRAAQERRIREARRRALHKLRTGLIAGYPEGGVPLSSHHVLPITCTSSRMSLIVPS